MVLTQATHIIISKTISTAAMPANHHNSTIEGIIKSISQESLPNMAGSSQAPQEAPALTVVMAEALPLETIQAITQALFWEDHQQAAIRLSLPQRRYMVANLNREIDTR